MGTGIILPRRKLAMHLRLQTLVLFTALVPGLAWAQQTSPKGDLAGLQGKWWTRVKVARTNTEITTVLTIEGDSIKTSIDGAESTGQIQLDESAVPKRIDFVNTQSGETKVPDSLAIYELKGDTLTICASVVEKKRPVKFRSAPSEGINLLIYKRGEPPPVASKKGAPRAGTPKTEVLRGATILKVGRITAILGTADGRRLQVITNKTDKVLDAEGKTIYSTRDIFKEGNVVDATLVDVGRPSKKELQVKEIQLVRGTAGGGPARADASTTGAAAQGEVYKGALIVKVDTLVVTLNVGGRTVDIGRTNRDTLAYDAQGNQLPVRQQARVLKEGNKVDVSLMPRPKDGSMPIIKEIRLIEGQLAEPRQYLNSPSPGR